MFWQPKTINLQLVPSEGFKPPTAGVCTSQFWFYDNPKTYICYWTPQRALNPRFWCLYQSFLILWQPKNIHLLLGPSQDFNPPLLVFVPVNSDFMTTQNHKSAIGPLRGLQTPRCWCLYQSILILWQPKNIHLQLVPSEGFKSPAPGVCTSEFWFYDNPKTYICSWAPHGTLNPRCWCLCQSILILWQPKIINLQLVPSEGF